MTTIFSLIHDDNFNVVFYWDFL